MQLDLSAIEIRKQLVTMREIIPINIMNVLIPTKTM